MTARYLHTVGESVPQNTADSVKFTLPSQTTSLGLLHDDEPILWQFDEEVGLPVVSHMEHFGEMLGKYGRPDMRENGRTTTVPMTYTAYAQRGGHPLIEFTRETTLVFFAPESKIANDFTRLYVGSLEDYKQLAQGRPQIIWGEPYERPILAPSEQKRVREVCIDQPGKVPFRTTRPATEGWVRSEKLLDQTPTFREPSSCQQRADDD